MEDLSVVAGQLGLYFMTVLIGLFAHGFIVLPIIYTVCTRQWPFRLVSGKSSLFILYICSVDNGGAPLHPHCKISKRGNVQSISLHTSEAQSLVDHLKALMSWT